MADVLVTIEPSFSVEGEALRVLSARLRERLDEPSALVVEVTGTTVDTPIPAPEEVVGKTADLELSLSDASGSRTFHGLVVEADRHELEDGHLALRLVVAPRLWRLGKRRDCRTFQEKSVPDIVKAVLDGAGATDHEWKTTGSYAPRVYTVQYRETDLAFVSRLLAEEGIYFTVRQQDGTDVVTFGDDPAGLGPVHGATTLSYKHVFGHQQAGEHVAHLRRVHKVKSDKVFTRDYDFEKPKLKLETQKEGKDQGAHVLEVYQWPGRFLQKSAGDHYAQTLLDSLQAERDVVTGQTGVLHLEPGHRFTVDEHPYAPLNQEYLVTAVELELSVRRHVTEEEGAGAGKGDGHRYECRFTAIPTKRSAYRPPRRTAERVVPELQTAWTTGPGGKEIHTDKHGRVKVQFHWDRLGKLDDKSSTWMRTVQLPTGGAVYLPRMGWEVAVRYVEGDVDRPIVLGRLYNGVNKTPYKLPDHKARSAVQTNTSPGGGSSNEFRFDDTKGKEEMFFNASKDMSVDVGNNTTESVGNNSTHTVGSNHKLHVTNSVTSSVGASQKISVATNQSIAVQKIYVDDVGGSITETIGAARNMKIGGDHKKEVGTSASTTVGALMTDLVIGSVSESTPASIDHKVGAALVEITANARAVVVGGMRSETVGGVKIILAKGGVGVQVGAMMSEMVGGAIVTSIKGSRNDNATAAFTEIAAGAHVVKAANITFEAEGMISLVMGASIINITPASVTILGSSAKFDGATTDTVALILDN